MHSFFVGLGLLLSLHASAEPVPSQEAIFNTRTRQWLSLEQVAAEIDIGSIVVLGEQHVVSDNLDDPESILHHANQLRWLKAINREAVHRKFTANLAMEFLIYPVQNEVNQFLAGTLPEDQFLQKSGWGSNPFEPYGRLMWESVAGGGGGTVALNIPPAIARAVSQNGAQSLTPEQKTFLPPIWQRGGAEYFERFKNAMGGHVSQEKLENYFWAQSLWDDTMAWRAILGKNSNGPMTIVVGEFHVEFGHGLPTRLKRQGAADVRTLLQIALNRGQDFAQATAPDPKYGERADYIWVFTRN